MAASPHLVPLVAVTVALIAVVSAVWCWRALQLARRERAAIEERLQRERAQQAAVDTASRASLEAERELIGLKARFVSLVSHEFRTPLGIIMSAVELLKNYRDRLPQEKQQELLEDILASTRRMSSLMEQVLLLGRVDAGRIAMQPVPVDLPDLLTKIADEQRSASGSRCPILVVAGPDLGPARADVGLLRHIVSNLVSNAVKYSPVGAEVRLALRREADLARLEVIDRGIGIPEADQARLFEAFHRAGNVGEIPGSGLGLLIVKRCVELHGGRIAVRSRAGEGTTFEVALPLFTADVQAPAEADLAPRNMASRIVA